MKVLMTIPYTMRGGVHSFCNSIIPFFKDIDTTKRGRESTNATILKIIVDTIKHYIPFIIKLINYKYDIVFVNTSLNKFTLIRDSIFILLAKLFRNRVLLFIHGFEEELLGSKWLKNGFFHSDIVILLAEEFKSKISSQGYRGKIYVSLNPVDINIFEKITDQNLKDRINRKPTNVLFISRIEESKGILIALESFNILKSKYPEIILLVAGDGSGLSKAKDYVKKNNIKDVEFLGFISGQDKVDVLNKADLFLFPTFWKEGLPINILEAMCSGLPILSRPVGGVKDFFVNEQMGYLLSSLEPNDFSIKMEEIISSENFGEICKYNFKFGRDNFHPKSIVQNLEKIINDSDK